MTQSELISELPDPWPEELQAANRAELLAAGVTLVVLDDDPTGTQTVSDLPVLTDWTVAVLEAEFRRELPIFYLLTNSRALTPDQTRSLHREVGANLRAASEASGRPFRVISRSDSTLRGHFPLESDILAEALQLSNPLLLFVPFFQAGGRVTLDSQHYVLEKGEAIPAHETPFAQDNSFPFAHSYLPDYIAEKTLGKVTADEVLRLPLALLREGGPREVSRFLTDARDSSICVVDALELRDLEVLVSALPAVERGRDLIYRTAASFVQSRAGLPDRPLLTAGELLDPSLDGESAQGGLIVVGSHVPKTSAQLEHLCANSAVTLLELSVPALLEDPDEVLFPLSQALNEHLGAGQTVVLATSRERIDARHEGGNLLLSQTISRALVALVQSLKDRPRFLIAKGGITSSDLATDALQVRRAQVLGQILPGVPVWQLGEETRFPGLPYIIFPGNVGGDDALTLALRKLNP